MHPQRRAASRSLANRYQIRDQIGAGGMGIVYRAYDPNLGTDVVIKMPRLVALQDPELAGRFQREIQSLVKLSHPRIVRITDSGIRDGIPFAVMQYLSGGSLETRRNEGGRTSPMSPASLTGWLPAIAEALDFVHKQGYLHRDVKPSNILFDGDGNPYLSDFGFVKVLSGAESESRQATTLGVVLGTPNYVAPEAVLGKPCDGRADQYALAATVYDVLAGQPPFEAPTPKAVCKVRTTEPVRPLTNVNPSVPPAVAAAIECGLSKAPSDRYPDCVSFARAVVGALQQREESQTSASPGPKPRSVHIVCPKCGRLLDLPIGLLNSPLVCCQGCRTEFPPGGDCGAEPSRRPRAAPPRPQSRPIRDGTLSEPDGLPPWMLAGVVTAATVLLVGVLALSVYTSRSPGSPTLNQLPNQSTAADTGAAKEPSAEPTAINTKPTPTKPEVKDSDVGKERRPIGKVVMVSKPYPNLLLARQKGQDEWVRLTPERPVHTGDTLVALPGYRAGIRHDRGAELFLWGNLPELLEVPVCDAAVVIHNKSDIDLDFTLERGRVLVTNRKEKDPLTVRVTFNEEAGKTSEVWELTLSDPDAEVCVDVLGRYARETGFNSGEGPLCAMFLVVLKGQVTIKIDRQTLRPPSDTPSILSWDNKGPGVRGPLPLDPKNTAPWDKKFANTPQAAEARRALDEFLLRPGNKPIEVMLEESLTSEKPPTRNLAVYGLGALDNLSKLLDVLADQEERFADMRDAAIVSLRHWVGRRAEKDKELYDFLMNVKKFKEREAVTAMQLLHDFPDDQLKQPSTWEFLLVSIKDKKPIIRELAYWHLVRLVPGTRALRYYPGGGDSDKPERAYAEWKKLIPEGAVPKSGPAEAAPMPPR